MTLCCLFCLQSSSRGAEPQPLRVFILAGQSNMQGHAAVRTIDAMRLNPAAAPLLESMLQADGTPAVSQRVWISSLGSADDEQTGRLTTGFGAGGREPKIGPEFTFGLTLEQHLDGPILLIKTAWGGKSLHTDFRPPSAGPAKYSERQLEQFRQQGKDLEQLQAEKEAASGLYYRQMLEYVQKVLADIPRVYPDYNAETGYELSGFVWFQGWNDMVDSGAYPNRDQPGGYDQYSQLLTQFIRDVRRDLDVPQLPFVIGVLGVGGPTALYAPDQQRYRRVHQNFRDAMAAPAELPEFQGHVATVLTENYWDQEFVRLRERETEFKTTLDHLREAAKQGELTNAQRDAAIEKMYAENFTPDERVVLQQSTSNFEFHYLGSAGIMSQIGKGFAEALLQLLD